MKSSIDLNGTYSSMIVKSVGKHRSDCYLFNAKNVVLQLYHSNSFYYRRQQQFRSWDLWKWGNLSSRKRLDPIQKLLTIASSNERIILKTNKKMLKAQIRLTALRSDRSGDGILKALPQGDRFSSLSALSSARWYVSTLSSLIEIFLSRGRSLRGVLLSLLLCWSRHWKLHHLRLETLKPASLFLLWIYMLRAIKINTIALNLRFSCFV